MKRSYHAYITDADGNYREIYNTTEDSKEATIERIKQWCARFGHTLHEDTYNEREYVSNNAFVDACLNDIAGFKR